MKKVVWAVLGVGGVGKTTYIYRLLGLSLKPRITLRPGVYRYYYGDYEMDVIDVPGQLAREVALNFSRTWSFYVDLMVYMYDVTDPASLRAVAEIHSALLDAGLKPFRKAVLVGNKRDLAEEIGTMIEGDEMAKAVGASRIYYVSALKDPPNELIKPVIENL
ncbi:Rab family GTPase [Thermoproteus tenax]|uniref:Ras-like superfamily GTPase n=1 Tax=Thermoproteus tenax (strain ATCC 35583 / DSM 2078 / JCM 9277 / NBRC 100435 / Kra 1) TaxID=768679 RepID=G4RP86_THETK|nr:GTPase domain-containing protein [Thermoproteus tenax]CCC81381.1 Ras-like superfamily GTPase [Thermoproteus tenax Kra 1]